MATLQEFVSYVQDNYDQDAEVRYGRAATGDENVVDLSTILSDFQSEEGRKLDEAQAGSNQEDRDRVAALEEERRTGLPAGTEPDEDEGPSEDEQRQQAQDEVDGEPSGVPATGNASLAAEQGAGRAEDGEGPATDFDRAAGERYNSDGAGA